MEDIGHHASVFVVWVMVWVMVLQFLVGLAHGLRSGRKASEDVLCLSSQGFALPVWTLLSPRRHIQDPASQRLTWNKSPKSVLVVKKIRDASLLQPFKELCVYLMEVSEPA